MHEILVTGLLILCCLIGVAMTAIRLPGTWLIAATALGYAWSNGWARSGVTLVAVLSGVALFGEALEILASVVTARRAGASGKRLDGIGTHGEVGVGKGEADRLAHGGSRIGFHD